MSFLYTKGIKQIIPTKKIEDIGTSIFASGQGRCAMLTVPSSFINLIRVSENMERRFTIYMYNIQSLVAEPGNFRGK
jgi:hypothetical protein